MKYRLTFILLSSLLCLTCRAQKAFSPQEQKQMVAQVEKAAAGIKTMQCDFTQIKHLSLLNNEMKSTGKMYCKNGNMLRWEYTSPYKYCFVLNGNKVMLKDAGNKTNVIDVKSSKLFQEITRIMMNSITGECLSRHEDFSVAMYKSDKEWEARLTPLKKEMSKMFSLITLHINATEKRVTRVEMKERTGDVTDIYLQQVKENAPIADNIFSIGK